MATRILTSNAITKLRNFSKCRSLSSGKIIYNKSQSTSTAGKSSQPPPSTNVPGLSKRVVDYGNEPVGPGAAKTSDYKNPEYFSYNQMSYFEAEIEMLKYRCPQPSNKKS